MNPVALAALAGGALLVYHETTKSSPASDAAAAAKQARSGTLDPGMDSLVAEAVAVALKKETDPAALDSFAAALTAAGYPNSAAALAAKKGT